MPETAWSLSAPSCVIPGTVAENCRHLEGRVDEVGLCLFETRACLDYDANDLPPWLSQLKGRRGRLRWHLHLPLDLPWQDGAEAVCEVCLALARKTSFLAPRACVLHPPGSPELLQCFLACWQSAGQDTSLLCLENTRDNDLALSLPLAYAENCGICLDFGHALAFSQQWLLQDARLLKRVRVLHLYAPGPTPQASGHRHLSLAALEPEHHVLLQALMAALGPGAGRSLVLEVFHWPLWQESAAIANPWL